MSERCEVMKRKQKLQRRKKINRKAAATPQALTGNCRDCPLQSERIAWQTHANSRRDQAAPLLFSSFFQYHVSTIN